jgi:hypothetical protein
MRYLARLPRLLKRPAGKTDLKARISPKSRPKSFGFSMVFPGFQGFYRHDLFY